MIKLKTSFILLQIESVITSLVITMPVINLFYNEIGLSQLQLGIAQAVFMLTAILVDVPTGWLADRFSRRAVNMSGDLLAGVGFIVYANANSFSTVLLSEVIVALGMAATNGADVGLLKAYSKKIGKNYTKVNAKIAAIKPAATIVGVLAGGWLGASNIRWPFYVSGALFFIGAIISLFISEIGTRRVTDKHPIRDMIDIGKYALKGHEKLRWRVLAGVFSSNLTHTMAFILAPVFLFAGYDASFLGVAWAITWAANSLGALLARRYHSHFSVLQQISIPAVTVFACYLVLGISINAVTVWLFAIFNLVFGWYASIINPLIQQSTPEDIQSTVISFATVLRRTLYVPLVIIINWLAGIDLNFAMIGSFVIYGAIFVFLFFRLRYTERDATILT